MNRNLQLLKYLITDFASASLAWFFFYTFRKTYIEPLKFGQEIPIEFASEFYLAIIFVPIFWLFLYYVSGYYKDVYRKSRLNELGQTFTITLIGVLILFFFLLLDDVIVNYKNYYTSFVFLFTCHYFLTYIPRFIITSITYKKIQKKKITFNTLLIGSGEKALNIYNEILEEKKSSGNNIVGFINVFEKPVYLLEKALIRLGDIKNLKKVIDSYNIQEVIIAIETSERMQINTVINELGATHVVIKIIPDLHDIITGKVKMNTIFGVPLIQVRNNLMPVWQEKSKLIIDLLGAIIALILSIPIIILVSIIIKLTSKGPVIYSHERIGLYEKPFNIYKFRTMYADAEKNGPELSNDNDKRITPIGRMLRRWKIDEIPNFINVLKGQMSIVGPRPERKFYISKIINEAPHYVLLHKVKPGITSWGQVKFGYAKNVDEMIQRLRYDIIYINNMSLFVDLKIIIYTILSVLKRDVV